MRRRAEPAPAAQVPEELRSMAGVRLFTDPADQGDEFTRRLRAFHRWLNARRRWATDHGADYVDTFHPEWRPQ